MMIEVLSAYRFLRRMGGGQCLFMWEIRTSVLKLFLVDPGRMCYLQNIYFQLNLKIAAPYAGSGYAKEYGWPSHSRFLEREENACSPRL